MPIITECKCPYCDEMIVVEELESKTFPLGRVVLHKIKDYFKKLR